MYLFICPKNAFHFSFVIKMDSLYKSFFSTKIKIRFPFKHSIFFLCIHFSVAYRIVYIYMQVYKVEFSHTKIKENSVFTVTPEKP